MLEIETNFGCFGHFKDVLLFMQEEGLDSIEVLDVKYCLGKIIGKGIYTLKQIESIVND